MDPYEICDKWTFILNSMLSFFLRLLAAMMINLFPREMCANSGNKQFFDIFKCCVGGNFVPPYLLVFTLCANKELQKLDLSAFS